MPTAEKPPAGDTKGAQADSVAGEKGWLQSEGPCEGHTRSEPTATPAPPSLECPEAIGGGIEAGPHL